MTVNDGNRTGIADFAGNDAVNGFMPIVSGTVWGADIVLLTML